MGSRNGPRAYFKEEDDLNADGLVVPTSSTQSGYAVHSVVEHVVAYEVQGGLLDLPGHPWLLRESRRDGHGRPLLQVLQPQQLVLPVTLRAF